MSHTELQDTINLEEIDTPTSIDSEETSPADTTIAKTNTFALVAVILAFIQPIAGIVFGHIGMSQIKKNGDTGRGLALTALIVGYIYTAFIVAMVIAYVAFFVFWAFAIGSAATFEMYPDSHGW